jgi:hypothetical protein
MACRKRDVEELGRPQTLLGNQVGGGGLSQGKPAACPWGGFSRRVLGGGESPRHGDGRDGRTQPAQDTSAGHCRTGPAEATLPAGHRQPSASPQATPRSGAVSRPRRGALVGLLARPEPGGGQWGRPRHRGGLGSQRAGQERSPGPAAASETLPGPTGPTWLPSERQRPGKALRDSCPRRQTGPTGLCEAVNRNRCAGVLRVQ